MSVEDFFIQKDCVGLAMMLHDEALSETLVVRLDKMVAKVVLWFEAVCELLSCECYRNTGALQSLAEDFYDYFLMYVPNMYHLFIKLFSPKDDKLDQFWIDFNLGSECISFFIDDPEETKGFLQKKDGQAEALTLKRGVRSYYKKKSKAKSKLKNIPVECDSNFGASIGSAFSTFITQLQHNISVATEDMRDANIITLYKNKGDRSDYKLPASRNRGPEKLYPESRAEQEDPLQI
ncbi:unnamed protein product [Merluccius merluccius]